MEVAFFASLREVARASSLEVPAEEDQTVREVLRRVFEEHPEVREQVLDGTGELKDAVSIFLQGRNIRLFQGLDTPIGQAGRLALFPHVAGG